MMNKIPEPNRTDPEDTKSVHDRELFFEENFSSGELKGRTVRGGAATVASQAIKLVLQTGATAILARILMPADFGLIAMVLAISNFALIFKDLGLSSATVQKTKITHAQVNALFWINVGFSALLSLMFITLAPLISYLYSEPKLTDITMLLGATFLIGGMSSQHFALLRRQMRFNAIVVIDVLSLLASVMVAVAMAMVGAGYWALVGQVLAQAVFSTAMVWMTSAWRPSRPGWNAEIPSMLGFGGHITAFNALIYALRNFDNILIGVVLGASPLGLYSKAYNLLMLPIRQINTPLTSVALPALSRLQNEPERYRRFFLNMCSVASVVSIPIVAYSFVDADIIIRILLGEKWMSATETFRLLAPASLAGAVNFIPGLLCVSRGKADIQLRWAIWTAPLVIAGFCVGVLWGINGVAASFSITYPITFLIFAVMACKGSPVSVMDVGMALRMPLLAGTVAAMILIGFKMFLGTEQLPLLARPFLHFFAYLIFFVSVMALFRQGRADIKRLLKLRQNFGSAKE